MTSRERVIGILRQRGPMSRGDIGRHLSLSRATVSAVIGELLAAGLVVEDALDRAQLPSGPTGRPPLIIRLDRSAGAALGIDFGKRHLKVALADLGHQILAERTLEMDPDHDAAHGMELAATLVEQVLEEASVERSAVVGVGMGLPGPVNQASGELGSSTILPGWVGIRAERAMTQRLGLPVHVDNDANLGALAEWTWGAAVGCANVAYLKVSTGIGAGLIFDGRQFRGAGGTAGEIGHTIIDPNGPVCRCGNRGCLETLVGASALLELLRPSLGPLTLHEVLVKAEAGDAACRRVIADAGSAIGSAAATLCNLFNPERIVVGGDLGMAGDLLISPIRDALMRSAIPSAAADVQVVAGLLHERAEVLGAIALILRGKELSGGVGATREVA
jgi:predicted NBD/HSP70 family sugar kinase/biotin operon repressor